MKKVLFYVSGHGYGHAVRQSEVIRELQRIRPEWRILVRTQAPQSLLPDDIEYSCADFDAAPVEREDGIVIDEPATLNRLRGLMSNWNSIVEQETAFVSHNEVDLLVADVPPVAGDVANAAGIPCIAISNFTWNWIYEPIAPEYVPRLEQPYSHMDALLRLPFAHDERLHMFKYVVDAPLIARTASDSDSRKTPSGRFRVLMGSRAQFAPGALERASAEAPEFEFVVPPVGKDFPKALASCDLVIAKLGFGILADCIAARKPILYPPRPNFREEAILQSQINQHIPALAIPLQDFRDGAWASYLRQLLALPPVNSSLRTHGAHFCATYIAQKLVR